MEVQSLFYLQRRDAWLYREVLFLLVLKRPKDRGCFFLASPPCTGMSTQAYWTVAAAFWPTSWPSNLQRLPFTTQQCGFFGGCFSADAIAAQRSVHLIIACSVSACDGHWTYFLLTFPQHYIFIRIRGPCWYNWSLVARLRPLLLVWKRGELVFRSIFICVLVTFASQTQAFYRLLILHTYDRLLLNVSVVSVRLITPTYTHTHTPAHTLCPLVTGSFLLLSVLGTGFSGWHTGFVLSQTSISNRIHQASEVSFSKMEVWGKHGSDDAEVTETIQQKNKETGRGKQRRVGMKE